MFRAANNDYQFSIAAQNTEREYEKQVKENREELGVNLDSKVYKNCEENEDIQKFIVFGLTSVNTLEDIN